MNEQENFQYVQQTIDQEGFDYAFEGYSDFLCVEDKEFHKLRLEYLTGRDTLEKYIKSKLSDEVK